MSLISQDIPNLIGGVSQQPIAIRRATQSDFEINTLPSPVEGLKRRPPTINIAKLQDTITTNAYVHTVNRDEDEQYVVILTTDGVKVYDMDGVAKTVNYSPAYEAGVTWGALGYLANGGITNPQLQLKVLTIADYTFVVNTKKTVDYKAGSVSPSRYPESLLFLKSIARTDKYDIYVNDVLQATYDVPDTGDVSTSLALNTLLGQLQTNLGTWFDFGFVPPVLFMIRKDHGAFTCRVDDHRGNQAFYTIRNTIANFTDLPVSAWRDMIVRVEGDASTADDYYVKFVATADGVPGYWVETVGPGLEWELEPATMPHALVREANGTFTFKQLAWGKRTAGDYDSAPDPSFVDATITDIFFFKNRLGLLSNENVILSETGSFFNFFPKTVTSILDTSPIDAAAAHTKVSLLRHAIPWNEELVLLSDNTQFTLKGGDVLSPKTVAITAVTEYESSAKVKPVGVGDNIFFAFESGDFGRIREYYVDKQTNTYDAADITVHCPKYIPSNIRKIDGSTNENMIAVYTASDVDKLYIYKYLWMGADKIQSAWTKWQFGGTVKGFGMLGSILYVVIQYPDGAYLEKIDCSSGAVDNYTEILDELGGVFREGYVCHLDRRFTEEESLAMIYNESNNTTAICFPYPFNDKVPMIATRPNSDNTNPPGVIPVILDIWDNETEGVVTSSTILVKGKYDDVEYWGGFQYSSVYRFSPMYIRKTEGNTVKPLTEGRLQVLYMNLNYDTTGFFRVLIQPNYRDTSTFTFNGKIIGSSDNVIGDVAVESGVFRVPVYCKNLDVAIDIRSAHFLPFRITSVAWEGTYHAKSQKMG